MAKTMADQFKLRADDIHGDDVFKEVVGLIAQEEVQMVDDLLWDWTICIQAPDEADWIPNLGEDDIAPVLDKVLDKLQFSGIVYEVDDEEDEIDVEFEGTEDIDEGMLMCWFNRGGEISVDGEILNGLTTAPITGRTTISYYVEARMAGGDCVFADGSSLSLSDYLNSKLDLI